MDYASCTAQDNTQARTSDRQLEEFFRNPSNFYPDMKVSSIIYAVGPYDTVDDWDHGLWIFEWHRPTVRIRVQTTSSIVREVALMDHTTPSASRYYWVEKALDILWKEERSLAQ